MPQPPFPTWCCGRPGCGQCGGGAGGGWCPCTCSWHFSPSPSFTGPLVRCALATQLAATALLFIWAALLPRLLKIELGESWVAHRNGRGRRRQFAVSTLSQAVLRQVNFWAGPDSPKHPPPTLPRSDRYLRLYFSDREKRLCFSVVLRSWSKEDISSLLRHCGLTPAGHGELMSTYDFNQLNPGVLSGWLMFCTTRPLRYYSVIFGGVLLVAVARGLWGWLHG